MDLATLERNIKSLEKSLDSLERSLAIMTALVVIGLVLEYWHEIPEAIVELKKAKRILWKPICIIAGAILITVGVGGELFVQFFASGTQTDLRSDNHNVEILLGESTARAEQRTAELLMQMQPRDLNAKQQKDMEDALRPLRFVTHPVSDDPGLYLKIAACQGDIESRRFGTILATTFTKAGFPSSEGSIDCVDSSRLIEGISILTCEALGACNSVDPAKAKSFTEALSLRLSRAGIDAPIIRRDLGKFFPAWMINSLRNGGISIVVGVKPRTQFRHLNSEQQRVIADKLRPFSRLRFSVEVFNAGDDGPGIANDIIAALGVPNGAGWKLANNGSASTSLLDAGIIVEVSPKAKPLEIRAANTLVDALRYEGLVAPPVRNSPTGTYGANPPEVGEILISIGRKP